MNVRCYQGREGYAAGQMHKLGCHGKTWANVYNHDAIMCIHSHEKMLMPMKWMHVTSALCILSCSCSI